MQICIKSFFDNNIIKSYSFSTISSELTFSTYVRELSVYPTAVTGAIVTK